MPETLDERRAAAHYEGIIGVVYGFSVLGDEEFRYVGQTTASVRRRTGQHYRLAAQGRKTPFYDWLRKTPEEDVYSRPLEVITTSLADLGEAERRWIAKLKSDGHRLLNLTDGGLGPSGVVWTVDQREAARIRSLGRTGVSRPGEANPFFGREHTPEQREKWRLSRKGSNRGEKNPNFGKYGSEHPAFGRVVSEEARLLLSHARRGQLNPNFGKVTSEATRAKMSAARKGKPMPSSVRSAHTRYHTNKGVFADTCQHCITDQNNERDST